MLPLLPHNDQTAEGTHSLARAGSGTSNNATANAADLVSDPGSVSPPKTANSCEEPIVTQPSS